MPDQVVRLDTKLMLVHDTYRKHVFNIPGPVMTGGGLTWDVLFCSCGAMLNGHLDRPPAYYGLKSPWANYIEQHNLHDTMAAMGYELDKNGFKMESDKWR